MLVFGVNEISIVESGRSSLSKLLSKQDCFKNAAYKLQGECAKLENNVNKIHYAVQLANCELSTAGVKSECESDDDCLDWFIRVPQYWTSYSGYLKEVWSICYATRYHYEAEELKNLVKKATDTQNDNFQLYQQNKEQWDSLLKDMQKDSGKLSREMNAIVSSISSADNYFSNLKERINFLDFSGLEAKIAVLEEYLSSISDERKREEFWAKSLEEKLSSANSMGASVASIFDSLTKRLLDVQELAKSIESANVDIQRQEALLNSFYSSSEQYFSQINHNFTDLAEKQAEGFVRVASQSEITLQTAEKSRETLEKLFEAIEEAAFVGEKLKEQSSVFSSLYTDAADFFYSMAINWRYVLAVILTVLILPLKYKIVLGLVVATIYSFFFYWYVTVPVSAVALIYTFLKREADPVIMVRRL